MSSVQLNFTLRTTPTVRSLHLVGSWDNYKTQLPMSQDPAKKKSGAWAGTFKFQPGSLKAGTRYWYYYIMDGYHTTHDPARESVVEPTTQRKLNILDIPASASSTHSSSRTSKCSSRRVSAEIPRGRAISPSKIASPRPYRPGQTSSIANETYNKASLSELEARLARANIEDDSEDDSDSDSDSDSESDVPSLCSSRSGASSPASSLSYSSSASNCSCERYGITRAGNRVKLDCGGARCGGDDSDCSSESDHEVVHQSRSTRRHGVVIRS